jgi:hypothetical protein
MVVKSSAISNWESRSVPGDLDGAAKTSSLPPHLVGIYRKLNVRFATRGEACVGRLALGVVGVG